MTMVSDIDIEDGQVKSVTTDKGETYYADHIVAAVGREGADWLSHICQNHGIETEVGTVDIGVRVEVRDEVMEFLNKNLYEAKLVYYTPTFDDKVRTFCTNPSGEVATEYYENGLAVVNGHAYKSKEYKTNNTNFALLVSKNFTKPFKTPIEYGKQIAQLSNMLCDRKDPGADVWGLQERAADHGRTALPEQPDPDAEGRGAGRSVPGVPPPDHGGY